MSDRKPSAADLVVQIAQAHERNRRLQSLLNDLNRRSLEHSAARMDRVASLPTQGGRFPALQTRPLPTSAPGVLQDLGVGALPALDPGMLPVFGSIGAIPAFRASMPPTLGDASFLPGTAGATQTTGRATAMAESSLRRTRNTKYPQGPQYRRSEGQQRSDRTQETLRPPSDRIRRSIGELHNPPPVELREPRRKAIFPEKLHKLLLDLEASNQTHIASFTPSGRAFQVHDEEVFLNDVLSKHFRIKTMTSFRRQLYLYSFTKYREGNVSGYVHPYFQRDHPEWLSSIHRTYTKQK